MKWLYLFIILLLAIPIPHPAAGQIYIWIDRDGVKHYGNELPAQGAEVIGEEREIPYNAAKDQAREKADEKYWKNVFREDQETEAASSATSPAPERQQDSEAGSDVVHGSATSGGAIENRGAPGTDENMRAPRGSYASDEGKPGTYDNMVPPRDSYASEEGKPGTYDNMGSPGAGDADRAAGVIGHGRAR